MGVTESDTKPRWAMPALLALAEVIIADSGGE